MKKTSNILWGIVLIILGIIFGLNALEITNINIFFKGWWTLFIIIPSFIDLFKEKDKTGNIIGLLIGILLLLACRDIISFSLIWKLAFPVALVLIGLSIIFKDVLNNKVKEEIKKINKSNQKEHCVIFSGQEINFDKEEFNGCELNAIFGGIDLDLTKAKLKEDAVINACTIFGGIDIKVPEDVIIKIVTTSVFGGVSDTRKNKTTDSKVTIYVNATCIFGGIEIK